MDVEPHEIALEGFRTSDRLGGTGRRELVPAPMSSRILRQKRCKGGEKGFPFKALSTTAFRVFRDSDCLQSPNRRGESTGSSEALLWL